MAMGWTPPPSGDFGTHPLGGILGLAERRCVLVVLCPVRGALGGDLLPSLHLPFGTLGLAVEAGEFFGHQANGAVCDETAHRFARGAGGVVEASVCPVTFHRVDELHPRIGHVCGDDVQPV